MQPTENGIVGQKRRTTREQGRSPSVAKGFVLLTFRESKWEDGTYLILTKTRTDNMVNG